MADVAMDRMKWSYIGIGGRCSWLLAVLLVLPMLAVSCSKGSKDEPVPVISIQHSNVSAAKGSQFVSVTATGDWTIDLSGDWASVQPSEGTGSSSSIVLSYDANSSEESRMLEIVVTSAGGSATAEMTQEGSSGTGGNTGGSGSPTAAATWLELPATDADDGYDFFTHFMTFEKKQVRNYSFYWDYDNLVACWVAYPLVSGHLSGVSRSDRWGLDPLLGSDEQPVLYNGFSSGNNGWYARGHQIPSADRLNSEDANIQTFYGTNMTPQINNNFNGGIWETLEGAVRNWARSSDTLYVVTGCVTEGSTYYALDNNGKKVTVPTGYYKAILRYSKSSTIGYSGYIATAYYFDHKEYSDNEYSNYAMSVDDLEDKVGIDFFVNLPSKVGEKVAAQIEAQDPKTVTWW